MENNENVPKMKIQVNIFRLLLMVLSCFFINSMLLSVGVNKMIIMAWSFLYCYYFPLKPITVVAEEARAIPVQNETKDNVADKDGK